MFVYEKLPRRFYVIGKSKCVKYSTFVRAEQLLQKGKHAAAHIEVKYCKHVELFYVIDCLIFFIA